MSDTNQRPMDDRDQQLEYLMRRFGNQVLHLAYSYLRDHEEAEDAAQEVFLKVYSSLDKFRGQSSLFTWIYRITVNLCHDRLRKKTAVPLEQLTVSQYPEESVDVEEQALASMEEKLLFRTILELPLAYREVIVLHYLNQLSVKEIAQVTGASQSVVKVRLYRGRQQLKNLLVNRGVGCGE